MSAKPKILFVARVDSHLVHFHLPFFHWFQQQGYEVHAVSQGRETLPYCDKKFNLRMDRFPLTPYNLSAYKRLKEIIDNGQYSLIHCHTPTGGTLTRLAAINAGSNRTPVLYTAHGFHFFRGAPLKNWLFYYPAEMFLARLTDCLLTINSEDFERAEHHHFPAGEIRFVHGVGIDFERFDIAVPEQKTKARQKLGIDPNTFVMSYTAELSKRKNHIRLIRALAEIKDALGDFLLLLAGDGVKRSELERIVRELHLQNQVRFLGYCKNIPDVLAATDLGVSTSLQEGLPVNVIECLAAGRPVLVSDIRGHRDLITKPELGKLFCLESKDELEEKLLAASARRKDLAAPKLQVLRRQSVQQYSIERVLPEYVEIYRKYLKI